MTDGQLSCPFLHQLARLLSNSARVLSYRVSALEPMTLLGSPTIDSRPRARLARPWYQRRGFPDWAFEPEG